MKVGPKGPRKFKLSKIGKIPVFALKEKFHKLDLPRLPSLGSFKDPKAGLVRKKWLGFFRERSVYRFLSRLPTCLNTIYGVQTEDVIRLLRHYVVTYEKLVADKGEVYAVTLLKQIHGVSLRFAANSKFEVIQFLKTSEEGLPLLVSPFVRFLKGDVDFRRCALSILSLFKMVMVRGAPPTLEPITTPFPVPYKADGTYKGEFLYRVALKQPLCCYSPDRVLSAFRETIEEMFPYKHWKSRLSQIGRCSTLHVSSRNGPNGQSVSGSFADLQAVRSDPLILDSIDKIASLTRHHDLLEILSFPPDVDDLLHSKQNTSPLHSRLAIKPEAGGKTRYFAIVDYFTQSALKGFHLWAFKYLSRLPEDGTLSQDRVSEIVRGWTSVGSGYSENVYSTDLTRATDRLPAVLQKEIVWQIAGKEYADAWYNLVTARDFAVPNQSAKVRFNTGQPLGAYSSWAMLAITHHVLCRTALKLSNTKPGGEPLYVVVGDDNCLVGSDFEKAYKFLLVSLCRVDVSPLKGFSKEVLSGLNPLPFETHTVAEFCKRVFYNGYEISTVSPITLKSSMEYPVDFPMLIADFNKRHCSYTLKTISTLVQLGFNPDQTMLITSFPFTTALPSNILVELEVWAESFGLPWLTEEFKLLGEKVWFGKMYEEISKSISKFTSKVSSFKSYLTGGFETSRYKLKADKYYRRLLGLISDQISYTTIKLIEKIKPGSVDRIDLKRLVDGLIDLDDLSEVFSMKNLRPDDRPKRISARLQRLSKDVSKAFRGDLSSTLTFYGYYEPSDSSVNESRFEAEFIDAEDDWTFVVPMDMPAEEDS